MHSVSFSLLVVSLLIISNFAVQQFLKAFLQLFFKFFFLKENDILNAFPILKNLFLKKGLIMRIANIKLS